jgi:hypothetical protein
MEAIERDLARGRYQVAALKAATEALPGIPEFVRKPGMRMKKAAIRRAAKAANFRISRVFVDKVARLPNFNAQIDALKAAGMQATAKGQVTMKGDSPISTEGFFGYMTTIGDLIGRQARAAGAYAAGRRRIGKARPKRSRLTRTGGIYKQRRKGKKTRVRRYVYEAPF